MHFETTLPNERQSVKKNSNRRNYTTIYVGLTPGLIKKVEDLAEKKAKTESEILRQILDVYLGNIKIDLPYEPLRKTSPVGLKVLPRTIRKDQDARLRELSEKTGRKISEIMREAVESFS